MDAIWIAAALAVAVIGGWPVTAGLLRFAKSKTVRAVDAAESGEGAQAAASAALPGEAGAESEPVLREARQLESAPSDVSTSEGGDQAALPSGNPAGPEAAPPEPAVASPKVEVLRGGLLIGFLERAAVAVAIFSGQPVAIAYVVAIKGLGRYPELKDTPAASERFIIGTLASMLWSASVAVLAKALLL
ncbi:hypothetical protein ACT3TS_00450 [Specibacter sp. AOP5-B1-6]|uniref:hypothetical protein n=1 Tax=Specibacter sp. AOP5-B1-6 TaxID=3457653 RepID=UPI00402B8F27